MMVAATGSAAATEWQTLSPPREGFSIDFPAEPAMRDVVEMKSEAIEFFHDYRAFVDDGVFLVDVVRFTPAVRAARSDAELLDIAVDGVAGSCEATAPAEVPAAKGVAHDVTIRCPDDMTLRARFIIAAEWLYQVGVGGGSGVIAGPDAQRFFDSFRLD